MLSCLSVAQYLLRAFKVTSELDAGFSSNGSSGVFIGAHLVFLVLFQLKYLSHDQQLASLVRASWGGVR